MHDAADVIYLYDGSFEGLLCCVFESVYGRELPIDILPENMVQPSFFAMHFVKTDAEKARRVYESIPRKISADAAELVRDVFLSCAQHKEILILRFLLFGYGRGKQTMYLLSHPNVQPLLAAQLSLKNERHLLLGFLRFSDINGALVATIQPKNYILPYLQTHFCSRYMTENFLIFDRTHKAALVYQNRRAEIVSLEELVIPEISETEENFRALWQQFYKTIAITARENPRCRMAHCPKRYWAEMLEMAPELHQICDAPQHKTLPALPSL